jgi:hypothetical protein
MEGKKYKFEETVTEKLRTKKFGSLDFDFALFAGGNICLKHIIWWIGETKET